MAVHVDFNKGKESQIGKYWVSVLQVGRGDKTCPRPEGTKVAGVGQGAPAESLVAIVPHCQGSVTGCLGQSS